MQYLFAYFIATSMDEAANGVPFASIGVVVSGLHDQFAVNAGSGDAHLLEREACLPSQGNIRRLCVSMTRPGSGQLTRKDMQLIAHFTGDIFGH